jgi:hypothetical protein
VGTILLYLAAIVWSNVSVALWGQAVVLWNAALFISLDLVARDRLHDRWAGPGLWPRMLALVAAGGLLSALLNVQAGLVAVVSCLALVGSGLTDAAVYQAGHRWPWLVRVNASNLAAGLVDSWVFLGLLSAWVLPSPMPATVLAGLVLTQWGLKVAGGLVWSLVWSRVREAA